MNQYIPPPKVFTVTLSLHLDGNYVERDGSRGSSSSDRMQLEEHFEIGPAGFMELMGIMGRVKDLADSFRAEVAAKGKAT